MNKIYIDKKYELFISEKDVLEKKGDFYISNLNYETFMKILSKFDEQTFLKVTSVEDKELLRIYINSLLFENKNSDISSIISLLKNIKEEDIYTCAKNYFEQMNEYLNEIDFEQDTFKAVCYSKEEVNVEFIFENFRNIDVLFVFDTKLNQYKIYTRDLKVIEDRKKKEVDFSTCFQSFQKKDIKRKTNKTINDLIREILNEIFDLTKFFEEFKDEVLTYLANLLLFCSLDETIEEEIDNELTADIDEILANKIKKITKKAEKTEELVLNKNYNENYSTKKKEETKKEINKNKEIKETRKKKRRKPNKKKKQNYNEPIIKL